MTAAPTWSPQQEAALKAVADWLADPDGAQVFRLFGVAGAGKTTLAKTMAADAKGKVQYASFTGKAALVLRKKGCAGASTIHSMIYIPEGTDAEETPRFVLNPNSSAADAKLIVIDEVSMVGEDLAKDLLSFGTRVLVLGDPAQLPPVKGEGFFINAEPDIMLTEVHRQAADNPIIRMSMDVREGRPLHAGRYGDSRVVRRCEISKDAMRELVMSADQVLCGLNKTRHSFNSRIREIHGRQGVKSAHHPAPASGLFCSPPMCEPCASGRSSSARTRKRASTARRSGMKGQAFRPTCSGWPWRVHGCAGLALGSTHTSTRERSAARTRGAASRRPAGNGAASRKPENCWSSNAYRPILFNRVTLTPV